MKTVTFEITEKKTEVIIDGERSDITNTEAEKKLIDTLKELQTQQMSDNFTHGFIRGFISIFYLLFCMITPIFICMIPVIPYVITDESKWLLLILFSFPIGASISMKMWQPKFMSRHL